MSEFQETQAYLTAWDGTKFQVLTPDGVFDASATDALLDAYMVENHAPPPPEIDWTL